MSDLPCILNPEPAGTKNSYWMPTAIFDPAVGLNREALFARMKEYNIDSRPFFYPLFTPFPCSRPDRITRFRMRSMKGGINLPSFITA